MRPTLAHAFLPFVLALAACSGEAPPAAEDTGPIVGIMELPISARFDPNSPSNALAIDVSPSELRVAGTTVLTLEAGRVATADVAPDGLTKLRAAIQAQPARQRAAITSAGTVGYGTIVRTLQTLAAAGYRDTSFAVRPASSASGAPPAQASWLSISNPQFAEPGTTPVDPATYGGGSRPWSDFVTHWDEVYEACRAGRYVDCDPSSTAAAPGGFLQAVLFSRGQAAQVRFNRVGEALPDPAVAAAAAAGPALLEGLARPAGEAEPPPDPRVTGTFTLRSMEATSPTSAITNLVRPVCGAAPCQTVVEADESTAFMSVVSLLGAAFPNGAPAPVLIFRLPRRDH